MDIKYQMSCKNEERLNMDVLKMVDKFPQIGVILENYMNGIDTLLSKLNIEYDIEVIQVINDEEKKPIAMIQIQIISDVEGESSRLELTHAINKIRNTIDRELGKGHLSKDTIAMWVNKILVEVINTKE